MSLPTAADASTLSAPTKLGSDFMKFGSALMREPDGNWWVIDFGPFANFCTFAISDRQDVMLLGDRNKGTLSWWEVDRHMMLGGAPETSGRAELSSLSLYPDGSFILGMQMSPGQAVLKRMEPFTQQQTVLSEDFTSIGDIEMDRKNGRYLVTDPAAGRLVECSFNPPVTFNESVMRQIVRSAEGMMGVSSEAPAFLNTFFERLQTAAADILPDDTTHAVQFNLSDIAGKMPIVAGRVRAKIEVEDAEEDPLEQIEFFLLFPSKVVMTETAVSPSMSFFSARRKSGKVEQTKPVFEGDVGVYRLSGTNISKIAAAPGGIACSRGGLRTGPGRWRGLCEPVVSRDRASTGTTISPCSRGPANKRPSWSVKSLTSESGTVTYEASFMDDATIEGMDGTITKEQLSNLLISGFGSAAARPTGRSVGSSWASSRPA